MMRQSNMTLYGVYDTQNSDLPVNSSMCLGISILFWSAYGSQVQNKN